ncbi:MAG: insulinase family protein [Deltaproteobacteria bacterium]|nr:insulinase family protein [Deltaproteobacteria bacterium]MBI3387323.1 insulinase family protein [Deltaproteobacteria bacterium]
MRRTALIAFVALLEWAAVGHAGVPPATYGTLDNGAILIVSEQRSLPVVVIQITIDAGARLDPPAKAGLANLTSELLTEGTTKRSASEISDMIDFLGASLDSNADVDFAGASLAVLKKDLPAGLDLLADVLLRPAFADAELVRRREAVLASIRASEDQPGTVASRAFQRALFGSEPYGHPVEGTIDSVPKLTRADIQSFYRQYYRPGRSIVTVVGDVSTDEIKPLLDTALQKWIGGAGEPFVYPLAHPPEQREVTIDKPLTQANIILGQRGVARDNPDYYAITVMNYILGGGGFSSRLLDNIRTRGGLAYSVSSAFSVNKAPGSFEVVMQTKSASAGDAIARARSELERIRREPVADDELSEAKRYLTGSFPLRLDSTRKISAFLSQVEFYGLGRDYADTYAARINAVTKEDVLRVAQQYLHPEEMILVVVANLKDTPLTTAPPAANVQGSEAGAH